MNLAERQPRCSKSAKGARREEEVRLHRSTSIFLRSTKLERLQNKTKKNFHANSQFKDMQLFQQHNVYDDRRQ